MLGRFPSIKSKASSTCVLLFVVLILTGCSTSKDKSPKEVQKGNPAHSGGTATVRKPYAPKTDDPTTSNDESNDQPIGHLGTVTLTVFNFSSGHEYTLDADVEDGEVQRLYFPKGGWVDFTSSEIDNEGNGTGTDEEGRQWEFRGLEAGSISDEDSDSEDSDETNEPEEENEDP